MSFPLRLTNHLLFLPAVNSLTMYAFTILLWVTLLAKNPIHALVGYECGKGPLNVTTLSLIDVAECQTPDIPVNITQRFIQLLQINEFEETEVLQCKIEVHRTIYHCGMWSHVSVVSNGENNFIKDVHRKTCQDAHLSGALRITNRHVIHNLHVNDTVTHPVTLAGTLENDGDCNGETYSDAYGSWSDVVVQGTVTITLSSYTARVNMDTNKVHLRSGTVCELTGGECVDLEGGYTFWSSLPRDTCQFSKYGVLFEGQADKTIGFEPMDSQTVYSLSSGDITFALTAKSRETVCGYNLIRTEHPKLVIFETDRYNSFAKRGKVSVSNLDIFAYVNSKFVYVEKHIRTQLKRLYRDVLKQQCELERETIKNALAIATQSPDAFAFHFMKGPGYVGLVAGEVVHIIKCVPVEVKMRESDGCFIELPVANNNEDFFLTPRTHILKKKGTSTACNSLLPAYFQIGQKWYKMLPHPTEAIPPATIVPGTKPSWEYIDPSDLATSGIYSDKDVQKLRDRIMFPIERPAVLNNVAREINGHRIGGVQNGFLAHLLNEDSVTKIVNSTWQRIQDKFMSFGTASAGVIAIIMICQLIKIFVDILIRGYTLHSVFGWSFHLLGALWDVVTYCLLHRTYNNNNGNNNDHENLPHTSTTEPSEIMPLQEAAPTAPTPKSLYNGLLVTE